MPTYKVWLDRSQLQSWTIRCLAFLSVCTSLLGNAQAAPSIARIWNERALAAIRQDAPHPPAQARNLFSFSVCLYDAWAAYDTQGAVGYVYHGKHRAANPAAARHEAMSFAVYRMMKERHAYSRTAFATLLADDAQMTALGYDPGNESRDPSTPAGVGNAIYDAVSRWFSDDGARQTHGTPYPVADPPIAYPDYPSTDPRCYVYLNPPLVTSMTGINDGANNTVIDINRWQRLQIVNAADQNGFPTAPMQGYLGAQWLEVRPFSLVRTDPTKPWIDPGAPPYFASSRHAEFVSNVIAVVRASSELTPDDGVTLDISPATQGNNTLGTSDGTGHRVNPVTGLPYPVRMAKRGDYARALAEFWADGPSSETPPGHWNVIANDVSDHAGLVKRIGGVGPFVDDLEWDVKLYFSLNAGLHEAACAAWSIKRYYDAWRPISAVRFLGGLGQSSDRNLPSFHPRGMPLIPDLIELVTVSSAESGGRHQGLVPGKVAIRCWPGQPAQQSIHQGVRWIHADAWFPYQARTFVTPAFPGYLSGHSTFSRAAAEIMTALTGSPYFPGGFGQYTVTRLFIEAGPTAPVTLQWATYFDAADQIGLSRIWGGIHPPVDDFAGRRTGAQAGQSAWALARSYFDGSVLRTPMTITLRKATLNREVVRYNAVRGFFYRLESTTDLGRGFGPESDTALAYEGGFSVTNTLSTAQKFYRAVRLIAP